jgi:hydroxyethylthiazole kinase-like uncharacterized protein yjeF
MRLDQPDLPSLPPAELLPPNAMSEADRASGVPGITLMERAGWAVAQAARRFGRCRVLVLCGPGNNGGDGYVAARLRDADGWPVQLAATESPKLHTDAAIAASRWHGPAAPFTAAEAARADLVIDAVFGAGLDRPIPSEIAAVLAAAQRVLAVDVPSGLDGATGQPRGEVRKANATITFFRFKPGHWLLPGRALCGVLHLADIGIPPAVLTTIAPNTFLNRPGLWRLPRRTVDSHKYTAGDVTVLGGAKMTGAARLAAEACRCAGAGLVTIAALEGADLYRVAAEPGVIVSEAPIAELLADDRRRVWLCGPGLGSSAAAATLPALIAAGRTIVADADALTLHTGNPEALRGVAVITPHAGEFARLFGDLGPDRLTAARSAAARIGAIVVLKAADTVIAAPDGRAAINASAPSSLATAGAGDVLAGIVAALLGQGMDSFAAASAAVWLHGRAAALAGPFILAESIAPAIALALSESLSAACARSPRSTPS